jgi:flagellar hook-associated protein 3 FlgL
MRITHGMVQENLLRNISSDFSRLAQVQRQVATGKRIHTVSDDPVSALQTMRAASGMRAVEQHRRNGSSVRARLDAEESVLTQMTDLLARGRELAALSATSTTSAQSMAGIKAEVEAILEQVIQMGNTTVNGEFIFAGHQTHVPAFQSDGTYDGDAGTHEAQIGTAYRIQSNHTGDELLVSSNVISGLEALRDALDGSDNSAAANSLNDLDTAFSNVQTLLAEVGSRIRQLDVAAQNLDALDTSLTATRQAAEEIDLEDAVVKLFGLQTTLQAALASTAKVLSTNLTEYIR